MFKFKQSELDRVSSDYSIYHPNIHQIKILYAMADVFAQDLGLEPDIVRLLLIQMAINFQQETQLFFYQHIYEIPAFRLSNSQTMMTWLETRLISILDNPTEEDKTRLSQVIEDGMKYYIKEFAGKKYSRD